MGCRHGLRLRSRGAGRSDESCAHCVAPGSSHEIAWFSAVIKVMPLAMHSSIITSALLALPTDIVQADIAAPTFVLDNTFTISNILFEVIAGATYDGLLLLGTTENAGISFGSSFPLLLQPRLDSPSTALRTITTSARSRAS